MHLWSLLIIYIFKPIFGLLKKSVLLSSRIIIKSVLWRISCEIKKRVRLRGESVYLSQTIFDFFFGTISLAMICCDLRLKSKTVLMFWDRFCPKGFGVLFQKRILVNKSIPIWDNKHKGLGQNLSQNIETIIDLSCCNNNSR